MAFDPNNAGIPTPNINPQPTMGGQVSPEPTEQQIRTMRGDLGASNGLPVFDADEPVFTPETSNQMPEQISSPTPARTPAQAPTQNFAEIPTVDQLVADGQKGAPWMMIGGVAGFIVLALVGYFFVYPMLTDNKPASPATPATPIVPVTPIAPAKPVEPIKPVVIHKTQFMVAPTATVNQTVNPLANGIVKQAEIKGGFVSQGQTAKQGITEIIFADSKGTSITFDAIISSLMGSDFSSDTFKMFSNIFENDGTFFIYKDEKGIWPGYIAEIKGTADASSVAEFSKWMEKAYLEDLFVVDPGTLAPFKNGTIGKLTDRYSAGSTAGASLGYLTTKNKLLISTSFAGMKEAIRLIGL
jgi:hypothetical protein